LALFAAAHVFSMIAKR